MKKRVTVILGAGAMIEATGVSTQSLTETVKTACEEYILRDGEPILESFARNFKASKNNPEEANFEDLFDIIENYVDYARKAWDSPANRVLSSIKDEYENPDFGKLIALKRQFLDTINCAVNEYDSQFSGKSEWMKHYFDRFIQENDCALDVFNLNYDTWIEQILGEGNYEDGFEELEGYEFKRFRAKSYLTESGKHKIAHIHGQILFGEPEFRGEDENRFAFEEQGYTLYKYSSFKKAQDYRNRSYRSDGTSQSGHNIFYSNIITGRMKTDKLIWSPMQIYMYGLMKAILENEDLIIIGYGFGDQYLNSLLYQYIATHPNGRVKMITYSDPKTFEEDVICGGSGVPFKRHDEAVFSKCIMKNEGWCNPYKRGNDGKYVSNNGLAEIYINGFYDFCSRHL